MFVTVLVLLTCLCGTSRACDVSIPDRIVAEGAGFRADLVRNRSVWAGKGVAVSFVKVARGLEAVVSAPQVSLETVRLYWRTDFKANDRLLTDRDPGYWTNLVGQVQAPWFFLIDHGNRTEGWGVMTQPNAMVCWQVSPGCAEAVLDVRAGGRGVLLGARPLSAAVFVRSSGAEGMSAFETGRSFCRQMCPMPRLPAEPVYGYNDWYCAYGANTATNFLADAACVVEMSKGLKTRPFVVMDDGWQCVSPPVIMRQTGKDESGRGPWVQAGDAFGMEMREFSKRISALGAKPGLWYRALRAWDEAPAAWKRLDDGDYFDPTVPAVLQAIRSDVMRFRDWGFKMMKADYLSYDFGLDFPVFVKDYSRWASSRVRFRDESRTTAEVILSVYRTIREAAGDGMTLIGCNAVNHLAPGIFEIQRTGLDTSGTSWAKTVQCGVNAIGMRNIMNGTFYCADPDCIGLARADAIPWSSNRLWLDLIVRSGSPLFVSWHRSLMTPEVSRALSEAFAKVSRGVPPGEPLDWQVERVPRHWRFADGEVEYDWFGQTENRK